jgi:hypothetical protein
MTFEPQVLHSVFRYEDMGIPDDVVIAEVKQRAAHVLAEGLAEQLTQAKGGSIFSPVTYMINEVAPGSFRIDAMVNYQRLPDPENDEYRLQGGRMHGRVIRVGSPAPAIYRLPVMLPVQVMAYADLTALSELGLGHTILEYRHIPGTQAYEFVRDVG